MFRESVANWCSHLHREQRLENASRVWDLREPGQGSRPLHLVLSARNPRHAFGTEQLAATHPTPDAKEVNLKPIITVRLENTELHDRGLVVELCGPMDAQVACIQQDSKASCYPRGFPVNAKDGRLIHKDRS